jgi:hypothetical protein
MKKRIKLSAKWMIALLAIHLELKFGLWQELNEKLDKIDLDHEGEIPEDSDEIFQLSIPVDEIVVFEETLQEAGGNEGVSDYWETIQEILDALPDMLENAPEEPIVRKVVVTLGSSIMLSEKTIATLKSQNIEVIPVNIYEDAEKIISTAIAEDEDIIFEFMLIVERGLSGDLTEGIYAILGKASNSIPPLYYIGEGSPLFGNGICIVDETGVDWQDIGVDMPKPELQKTD